MSVNVSSEARTDRPLARPLASLPLRSVLAAVGVLALLLVGAACGTGAQTLRPYTPAEGVNLDVGDPAKPREVVHVRNLLIISEAPGQGVLSASMSISDRDALTGVSGTAIKADGTNGAPLTVTLPGQVPIANSTLVVLTANPSALITVRSADLKEGLTADVTLTFGRAGEAKLRIPVVSGAAAEYSGVKPSAAPTPTPTPSPSPSK